MHPPDPYTHLSPSYPLCKEVKFTSVLCPHTIHPHPGATDQEVPRWTSRHCRAPTCAKLMPGVGPQRLGLQELTVDQPSRCDGPQVASWQRPAGSLGKGLGTISRILGRFMFLEKPLAV